MPMMVTGWSAGSSKMGIDVLREAAHRNMGHAEPLILLIFILWLSRFLIPWIPWMRGSGVKKMVRGKLQKTYKIKKKHAEFPKCAKFHKMRKQIPEGLTGPKVAKRS